MTREELRDQLAQSIGSYGIAKVAVGIAWPEIERLRKDVSDARDRLASARQFRESERDYQRLMERAHQAEAAIELARDIHARNAAGHDHMGENLTCAMCAALGQSATEWCKCGSCWGWFVEEHPGEDLDDLGRDRSWWSGLPVHREPPPAKEETRDQDPRAAS